MKSMTIADGLSVRVDDEDFSRLRHRTWRLVRSKKGGSYVAAKTTERGRFRLLYLHREVLDAPAGVPVDHINGDTLDNRKENLRLCSASTNQQNRHAVFGASRYKGVCWHKSCRKWQAAIKVEGRSIHLGLFADERDAALAYDQAARRDFGDFAHTNFEAAS